MMMTMMMIPFHRSSSPLPLPPSETAETSAAPGGGGGDEDSATIKTKTNIDEVTTVTVTSPVKDTATTTATLLASSRDTTATGTTVTARMTSVEDMMTVMRTCCSRSNGEDLTSCGMVTATTATRTRKGRRRRRQHPGGFSFLTIFVWTCAMYHISVLSSPSTTKPLIVEVAATAAARESNSYIDSANDPTGNRPRSLRTRRRPQQRQHKSRIKSGDRIGSKHEGPRSPPQLQLKQEFQKEDERLLQEEMLGEEDVFVSAAARGGSSSNSIFSPRIVNGRQVDSRERYPYYVALQDRWGNHVCGGTLIAPDAVLTAAHCHGPVTLAIIGLYDRTNASGVQKLGVVGQYPHPAFERAQLSYDQMVIILARPVREGTPTVRVNLDPRLLAYNTPYEPAASRISGQPPPAASLAIVGFGQLDVPENSEMGDGGGAGGTDNTPLRLHETNVEYIDNERCKTAQQGDLNYADHITDDMICAMGDQTGQCYGDSGGPYLLENGSRTPATDLQIGIVSFGVGCANPTFPSVASRTSASNWIPAMVCLHSESPPAYFMCELGQTFAPSPTQLPSPSPTMRPIPTPTIRPPVPAPQIQPPASIGEGIRSESVTVLVTIFLDFQPEETSWSVWNPGMNTMFTFGPPAPYSRDLAGRQTQARVKLTPGQFYSFLIRDKGNNGIGAVDGTSSLIRFRLHLLKNPDMDDTWGLGGSDQDDDNAMMLLEGSGVFADESSSFFYVPNVYDDFSTDTIVTMANSAPVYLTIHFDDWSHETSWLIVDAKNENVTYARVSQGTYQANIDITEEIELPLGRSYTLIVLDEYGDGILSTDGYKLWMKETSYDDNESDANGNFKARDASEDKILVLVEGSGEFDFVDSHNFTLPSPQFG